MIDESAYQHLADAAFRRIETAFKDVDPDDVDCERAGDVLTLTSRITEVAVKKGGALELLTKKTGVTRDGQPIAEAVSVIVVRYPAAGR